MNPVSMGGGPGGGPAAFALLAGRGAYPAILIDEARRQGATRIVLIAFRGETDRRLARRADETHWINLGRIGRLLEVLRDSGVRHGVMVGQIAPTQVFRVRPDAWARRILREVPVKNPHTIFGRVVEELRAVGVEMLPASTFMGRHMPGEGCLTRREPNARERTDMALGRRVGEATSTIEIGQTVVIKHGIILAVEALEGTDRAIRRGARLGGRDTVVVKVAKPAQDMRFDIPVIGERTVRTLGRVRASCLAFQAGRAIVLNPPAVVKLADRLNIAIVGVPPYVPTE